MAVDYKQERVHSSILEFQAGIDYATAGVTAVQAACWYQLNMEPYDVPECDKSSVALKRYADCLRRKMGNEEDAICDYDELRATGWSPDLMTSFVETGWLLRSALAQKPLPDEGRLGSEWSSSKISAWLLGHGDKIAEEHPCLWAAFEEFARHTYSIEGVTLIPFKTADGAYVNCLKGCGGFGEGRIYDQFPVFLSVLKTKERAFAWPAECPGFRSYIEALRIPCLEFAEAFIAYQEMMGGDGIIDIDKLTTYLEALNHAYAARYDLLMQLN